MLRNYHRKGDCQALHACMLRVCRFQQPCMHEVPVLHSQLCKDHAAELQVFGTTFQAHVEDGFVIRDRNSAMWWLGTSLTSCVSMAGHCGSSQRCSRG